MSCQRAPQGWTCTREHGHDGPCAAWPTSIRERLFWAWKLKSLTILRGPRG